MVEYEYYIGGFILMDVSVSIFIDEILQEEQSLCFLKALQDIHVGQPRIAFSSPFCVAGVGRSIITLF